MKLFILGLLALVIFAVIILIAQVIDFFLDWYDKYTFKNSKETK